MPPLLWTWRPTMGDEYLPKINPNSARWKDAQQDAKATRSSGEFVMPFGKYKGMTLDQIAVTDPAYLVWMQSQPDFPVKVHNYEVRGRPNLTPAHNAMQVRFLDRVYCAAVFIKAT